MHSGVSAASGLHGMISPLEIDDRASGHGSLARGMRVGQTRKDGVATSAVSSELAKTSMTNR
jgi:hypothetical protein